MVWINTVCANTPCPPGHFGGAMCVCPKCSQERLDKMKEEKENTCRHGRMKYKCDICYLERELDDMKYWVTKLLENLPAERDWLDPIIENTLKEKMNIPK